MIARTLAGSLSGRLSREMTDPPIVSALGAAKARIADASNLITAPYDFSAAAWVKGNATVSADAGAGPDGTVTADKLIETTATGEHFAQFNLASAGAVPDNALMEFIVLVKSAERGFARLLQRRKSLTFPSVIFDLASGAISAQAASTEASALRIGDFWQLRFVVNTGVGATAPNAQVALATGPTTASYTGDGASGVLLWGASLRVVG